MSRGESSVENAPEKAAEGEDKGKNPFHTADWLSDVALVVEDKTLHVHKMNLALHSPVFADMFFKDYKEKDQAVITLPGKKYTDMVEFLLQLYPVHSFKRITDDNLEGVLALADEYLVEHVQRKCNNFIAHQITGSGKNLTTNQLLLYLYLCERHSLPQALPDHIMKLIGYKDQCELKTSEYYVCLSVKAQRDVLDKRCQQLEADHNSLMTSVLKMLPHIEHWTKSNEWCSCHGDDICRYCDRRKVAVFLKRFTQKPGTNNT